MDKGALKQIPGERVETVVFGHYCTLAYVLDISCRERVHHILSFHACNDRTPSEGEYVRA